MMQRTMTMTVIRGKGEGVDVIVNDVVKRELQRQNERCEAERQHANFVEIRRNKMLEERNKAMRKKIFGRRGILRRALDKIDTAYCVVFATLIEVGIRLKLWEYEEEEE